MGNESVYERDACAIHWCCLIWHLCNSDKSSSYYKENLNSTCIYIIINLDCNYSLQIYLYFQILLVILNKKLQHIHSQSQQETLRGSQVEAGEKSKCLELGIKGLRDHFHVWMTKRKKPNQPVHVYIPATNCQISRMVISTKVLLHGRLCSFILAGMRLRDRVSLSRRPPVQVCASGTHVVALARYSTPWLVTSVK